MICALTIFDFKLNMVAVSNLLRVIFSAWSILCNAYVYFKTSSCFFFGGGEGRRGRVDTQGDNLIQQRLITQAAHQVTVFYAIFGTGLKWVNSLTHPFISTVPFAYPIKHKGLK